jgi:O-antigen/teichoic acid export membrane protein
MSVQSAIAALRDKLRALSQISFLRSVGVLVGGTAFAQALTVLALPLVTRLYTPSNFSTLAVFVSITTIISVVACLRLEIAIPMPENDDDAANLLALALLICSIVAMFLGLTIFFAPTDFIGLAAKNPLRPYLWLLPLAVWLAGGYSAAQFWSTRKKKFGTIAKTRMTQALGGAGTQIGLGWMGVAPLGLLLGQTIGSGAGFLNLLLSALRENKKSFQNVSWSGMLQVLRKYDRFPKYSTFEAFANSAGFQLPIIFIASSAIGPEAGYLMLATRAMAVPMGLVGGAIAQVYLSKAPEELRDGRLGAFSTEILASLFKTGVGPLLFIGIVAPPLFSIVFGAAWGRSGEIVTWMIPWFIFQFMSSPISMVMHVVGKQRSMLALTIFGLLLRLGSVVIVGHYAVEYLSEMYAISGGVFYFACCWLFGRAAGVAGSAIEQIVTGNLFQVIWWVVAAVLLRVIFYIL